VHQVGYLPGLYEDARSEKYKFSDGCIQLKHISISKYKSSFVGQQHKYVFECNIESSGPELLPISLFLNPQGQSTRTKGMR
jgi:hypothetical protein